MFIFVTLCQQRESDGCDGGQEFEAVHVDGAHFTISGGVVVGCA